MRELKTYYLIPGNPPVRYFYEQWKEEIESSFDNTQVIISYFPLFERGLSTEEYFRKMNNHFRQAFKRDTQERDVHLIGHSIGGYLALNLLKEFANIKSCHLLFPFLGHPELMGKVLLNQCSLLERLSPIKNLLIENRKIFIRGCEELEEVKANELETGIRFAHHEKVFFHKNPQTNLEGIDKSKVRFYYAKNDMWCGRKTVGELQRQVHSIPVEAEHAFILDRDQREIMKELIFNHN